MANTNVNIVAVVLAVLLLMGGLTYALRQTPVNKSTTTNQSSLIPTSNPSATTNQTTTASSQPAAQEPTTATLGLNIVEPKNGAVVSNSNLKVSGKTAPNAEVFVNDKELRADSTGNFSITVALDEGDNSIIISANDDNGNFSEQELTITYEPSQ